MQKGSFTNYLQSPQAQLILVNSVTCGLEVCLAAAVTFVPPLLLEAGVEEQFMTMLLGIGPVLGLLVVHLIGSASDRWSSKYGRRRPFIWLLCFGVMLSLIIIPYSSYLASFTGRYRAVMDVTFLVLGISLLDACAQVCFTPLEALLSDLFPEGEACRKAFSVFALTSGLGACIGYLLPSIDWSKSWLAQHLGGQAQCLFTLLLIIFSGCVFATFFVSEEIWTNSGHQDISLDHPGRPWACIKMCQLWTLPYNIWRMTLMLKSACALIPRVRTFFCKLPTALWHLFVAQLCSWMAFSTFILFYTDFVGEGLYHGVPVAAPGTEARLRYDEGVRMGSLGLFLQAVTSIAFSFCMDHLVKTFGTRYVYLAGISSLAVAALIICFSSNVIIVTALAAITGFSYSVLQILPYTLISLYHQNRQVFLPKYKDMAEDEPLEKERKSAIIKEATDSNGISLFTSHSSSLYLAPSCDGSHTVVESAAPHNGICLDIAILDSACLLSQVVPTLLVGFIVQNTQTVTAYVASAAAFGVIAIYFSNKVVFEKSDMAKTTALF